MRVLILTNQSSTDVNFIASQALQRSQQQPPTNPLTTLDENEEDADAMAALERQARAPVGFVPASQGPLVPRDQEGGDGEGSVGVGEGVGATVNPDALEIEGMDED